MIRSLIKCHLPFEDQHLIEYTLGANYKKDRLKNNIRKERPHVQTVW